RRSKGTSGLSGRYPRSGLALPLVDRSRREQRGPVEPGDAQHQAARRVADEAVSRDRLESLVVAPREHRVLDLDEHAQRFGARQRGVVCLQHLPGRVGERERLALAAVRLVEELAVVVGGLPQPRQHAHDRSAHGAYRAIAATCDADGLGGARAIGVPDRVVALPELEQLAFERRGHLLPDRDRLETHGCACPLRLAATRAPTDETYSSNCRRLSPLASNASSAGASLPA